jgi:RNA polymerase sigma-70 factor (ECF subfamily)
MPFEDVYALYAARLHRFCLSQLRNASDAEDVTASVFLAAFRTYESAHPTPDRLSAWLFTIARRDVIDHARRQRRWLKVFSRLGHTGDGGNVEELAEFREELRDLARRMERLSRRDRELIGLRIAELSAREIGSVLGMREDAARMAVRRALQRVRALAEDAK